MKYRILGNTGIELSEVGFGCASYWGMRQFSQSEARKVFDAALDSGITFFDTGHHYSGDHAEIRLGQFLKETNCRSRIILSTKFGSENAGPAKVTKTFAPDEIKASVELSLKRLGTDYLDLLMMHSPRVQDFRDETIRCIEDMKKNGIARAIGVSEFGQPLLKPFDDCGIFDFAMVTFNMMDKTNDALIGQLHQRGKGIIAGSSLGKSLFAGRPLQVHNLRDLWYLVRALKYHGRKVFSKKKYRFLEEVRDMTPHQIALRYVLNRPEISSAVFGTTNPLHVLENVQATDKELPSEILAEIEAARV